MTHEGKRICAERLLDEIGLIDDRFISEAEMPYAKGKRTSLARGLIIAAAAITLTLCIGIGTLAAGMVAIGFLIGDKKDSDIINDADLESTLDFESDSSSTTLSSRFNSLRASTSQSKASRDSIELFGEPCVIWKYSDEAEYRVRPISDAQAEVLSIQLSKSAGARIESADSTDTLEGVWIAMGDGRVISPCLEQTAGNVGYGEVFEYEPEYEPSAEFSEYLCDVIS